jgi:signal-transduction protein with cAMP-binding, CBS, and nucleotidyltransferase domain
MALKVKDIRYQNVVMIEGKYTARQAAKMMDYRGISSLVVVSKRKLAGIVPEKDLYIRVVAKGGNPEKVKVSEIMTQPVIIVRPDSLLEPAIQVMLM